MDPIGPTSGEARYRGPDSIHEALPVGEGGLHTGNDPIILMVMASIMGSGFQEPRPWSPKSKRGVDMGREVAQAHLYAGFKSKRRQDAADNKALMAARGRGGATSCVNVFSPHTGKYRG